MFDSKITAFVTLFVTQKSVHRTLLIAAKRVALLFEFYASVYKGVKIL